MKHKNLIKSWLGFGSALAVVLLVQLPGSAQITPRSTSETGQSAPAITPAAPASRTSTSSLDQEFMKMAANSDQFEIRTSQLALEKTSNPEVKEYAQKMIQEHTESTQQLTRLASQRGVTLPSTPNSFQQAVIDQLTPLTGTQFDRAYLAAQTNGHMLTVAVFQTEIGQGKDQDIQNFASQLLPTIAGHYQMANQMNGQRNVLNPSSSNSNSMHNQ